MEYTSGSRTMYARAAKTKARDLTKAILTETKLEDEFEQMCVEDDPVYEPSALGSDADDSDSSSESDNSSDSEPNNEEEMDVY